MNAYALRLARHLLRCGAESISVSVLSDGSRVVTSCTFGPRHAARTRAALGSLPAAAYQVETDLDSCRRRRNTLVRIIVRRRPRAAR